MNTFIQTIRVSMVCLVAAVFSFIGLGIKPKVSEAVNYDCHYFKGFNGAGQYQGRTLCYALPNGVYQEAKMVCIISVSGAKVTLYGNPALNAQLSQTGWHSGICTVGAIFI